MFRKQDTKIHFVGIGGMGMCGLAEVLANMGYKVSGSDVNETDITRHLSGIGCTVKLGHRADNLGESDVVVVVLPWAPATAIANFIRISSPSISARGMTGIWRARAASTSGL